MCVCVYVCSNVYIYNYTFIAMNMYVKVLL